MPVLIVGSIALDTVKTPVEEHADLLGGSASYAAVSRELLSPTCNSSASWATISPRRTSNTSNPARSIWKDLQRVPGQSFRWSGEYMTDMNVRETRSSRAQRVRALPRRTCPSSYRQTPYVLLANIAPSLQSYVLDQMARPRFVVADTMDLWITIAKEDLLTPSYPGWTCSSSTTPRRRCSPAKPISSKPLR